MNRLIPLTLLLLLSACAGGIPAVTTSSSHPFVGCWQSKTGLSIEQWSAAPNGWLIGYAMNMNVDGDVTFFEQMRIERGDDNELLFVTGGNDKPIAFNRDTSDETVFRYINAEHDFPQVITYRPSNGRLDADISDIEKTNVVAFPKAACH